MNLWLFRLNGHEPVFSDDVWWKEKEEGEEGGGSGNGWEKSKTEHVR